ncbi:Alcohol dehydrogenase transcription factor Myb/SANT-like [Popillia japonica]|uniref:Alcohol dehydrogenase transcription factor Myb/SANT-like n=1 Tax=Popillia japonica TaxID=7064 RepID=A0AAW1LY70_POPJA
MPVDVALLLELIQQHPFLYDKAKKDFKDVHKKNNAWTEIATTLDCDADEVKTRWRTLRERFVKEDKIHEGNNTSGQSQEDMLLKWEWYDSMAFLRVHIKPRKTWESSVAARTNEADTITTSVVQFTEEPDCEVDQLLNSTPSTSSPNMYTTMAETPTQSRKRKRHTDLSTIDEQILNVLKEMDTNKQTVEDEDDIFCKSLACELRKVSGSKEKQKRKAELYLIEKSERL